MIGSLTVHPQGERNLDLSPKPIARPDVRSPTWTTPSLVSSGPTGSDSSASSSTDGSETPHVSYSANCSTPLSTRRKLRGFYPRSGLETTLRETYDATADSYPESPYALYGPESTSSLWGNSPRTTGFALKRRSGTRSLLGCALTVLGANWFAVVIFQRECRGRELVSREKFSSLVLVEKGAQVLPVEPSSTTGVAGTSEAEEEEDEAPPCIQAVRSRLVEQDPIILKFLEDELEDDATYVRF